MLYLTRKKPNKEIHCAVSERKDGLVGRAQGDVGSDFWLCKRLPL